MAVYDSHLTLSSLSLSSYTVYSVNLKKITEKQTALHLSAVHGSAESAAALLRHGAKKDVRDTALRTPLHLAAYDDCSAVVRVLLEKATQVSYDYLFCTAHGLRSSSVGTLRSLCTAHSQTVLHHGYTCIVYL